MQRAAPPTPGWFQGAPASKLLAVASVTAYAVFRNSPWTRSLNPWTNKWIFRAGTGQSFVGTFLLLYWSRGLERQTGSRKFVTLLLVVQGLATGFDQLRGNPHYMGPYGLLGAYCMWFHVYCPRVHPWFVQFAGLSFSEKSIGYLLFAWVVGAEGMESMIAAGVGMASWWLYHRFLEKSVDIPDFIARWVGPHSDRFLEPPPPVIPTIRATHRMRINRAMNNNARPARPVAAPRPPSEPPAAAIEQLVNMGFPRPQVIQALQASNNSVERAADILLSGL